METARGHDRKLLVCLYEFLGQIFFMYMVLVSAGYAASPGLAAPLALFASASIFGTVSGGHFNPAVTIGVYIREGNYIKNLPFCLGIIASQIAGALTGMLLSYLALSVGVNGKQVILQSQVSLLLPEEQKSQLIKNENVELTLSWATMYMQVICTFVFVFFILHVTGKHTKPDDLGVWGLPAICLVLWALISVDYFTGASFNPAIAIGQTVWQRWWYPNNPQGILTHYLSSYVFGACFGGILAGFFYLLHLKYFIKPENPHAHSIVTENGHNYGIGNTTSTNSFSGVTADGGALFSGRKSTNKSSASDD